MATEAQVLRGDRLQPGWLMFVDSTPAVRIWSGAANFKLGPCGLDTAGGVYQGLGLIVGVPSLKVPINGSFSQHVFSLSGVTADMMQLANADRDAVRGARVAWARVDLDADGQPVAEPVWVWQGWVDSPRVARDGSSSPPTRTVSLVTSSGSVRRRIRQFGYWTSPQQRTRDPNDSACDQVATYAAGTDTIWPT
ncbi:MAG: hypothetical protein P4L73_13380 [Caulobacteraceae bacterium]|nr:hypothetical protein [Caulobacteraceae bacterium]